MTVREIAVPADGAEADEPLDRYAGICAVCGAFATFAHRGGSVRESYRCDGCDASMRYRGQARVLVDCYGPGLLSLKEVRARGMLDGLRIFEPGVIGPFRKYLGDLPNYRRARFDSTRVRGEIVDGIPNEDLEQLTFPDRCFDLVITSDILEHVREPFRGFAEIARVLKPGGRHVFTVPLQFPMPRVTQARVNTAGVSDELTAPAEFHGDGQGGCSLVYTDFGEDMLDRLDSLGLRTTVHFADASNADRRKCLTFSSIRRPGA